MKSYRILRRFNAENRAYKTGGTHTFEEWPDEDSFRSRAARIALMERCGFIEPIDSPAPAAGDPYPVQPAAAPDAE